VAPLLVLAVVVLAAAPTVTAAGTPAPPPPPQGTLVDAGEFHVLTPARVLDTRVDLGGHPGVMQPGETFALQLTGRGGVPAGGVSSVVLNVTSTEATGDGFVAVFPSGAPRPAASTLNLAPGGTVANSATARVGAGGRVDVYLEGAASHIVVDVVGWYDRFRPFNQSTGQAGYVPLGQPVRVLDSRTALGGHGRTFGPGESFALPVAAAAGVPADATAVALSITGAQAGATTFVTVWNAGAPRPTASTLNLVRGQTAANSATVPLSGDGSVSLYNNLGTVHLVIDVMGYFRTSSDASSGQFAPLPAPTRLLDTRAGTGGRAGAVPGGQTITLAVAGVAGVPRASTRSVVLTVTATQPSATTFVTVWPGGSRPATSNLNVVAGETRAVLVLAALGSDGAVRLYNNAGAAHLIVDVVGWYTGVTPPAAAGNPALPGPTAVSSTNGGRSAVGHGQQRSPEDLRAYWTLDRMAQAAGSDMAERPASAVVVPTPTGKVVASGATHPQFPVFSQGYLSVADHRNAIGRLYATTPDGTGGLSCSGTVVARNVVLTAAHCVYSLGQGFNNDLVFAPGQSGATFPFGTWQPQAWYVYPQFYSANSGAGFAPLDYALLVFGPDGDGTEIGSLTGYLPVLGDFVAGTVTSYGYPAEGWFQSSCADVSCQVWSCTSPVSGYSTGAGWFEMGIGCNTAGGASGGPMIAQRSGTWYVVSVNSNSSNDVEAPDGSRYYTGNMWGPVLNSWTTSLLAQHARY